MWGQSWWGLRGSEVQSIGGSEEAEYRRERRSTVRDGPPGGATYGAQPMGCNLWGATRIESNRTEEHRIESTRIDQNRIESHRVERNRIGASRSLDFHFTPRQSSRKGLLDGLSIVGKPWQLGRARGG